MKYQKPIILDLNARAASGQVPLMCMPGNTADGGAETCVGGAAAGYACQAGTVGDASATCISGATPAFGNEACISGGSALECGTGSIVSMNYGCNTGPSIT